MPKLTITPQSVLLTSGQAITFEVSGLAPKSAKVGDGTTKVGDGATDVGDGATDVGDGATKVSSGAPTAPEVNWTLIPQVGKVVWPDPTAAGATPAPAHYTSATYAAPAILSGPQTIAIVVHTDTDSASATISLTPVALEIVPATVDIEEGESQQFEAIIAPTKILAKASIDAKDSIDQEKITWILSPDSQTGTLDDRGLYKAPGKIFNSTTVRIIAASPALGKHAVATVNLLSPPWRGPGAYLLGIYLLLLFSLVIFMVGLWPPALPSPDIAELNRVKAETNLQAKSDLLDKANKENIDAKAKLEPNSKVVKTPQGPNVVNTGGGAPASDANNKPVKGAAVTTSSKTPASTPVPDASFAAQADVAEENLNRAQEAWHDAQRELDRRREEEREVRQPTVQTKIAKSISREIDLLLLVLLGGSLGSFLHIAPSFSDFMGNRSLKSSWAWWYALRPFIGAGLALVFYSATRAGLITNPATLNPFGVVAIAALVGLFSKSATLKLGEVFDTLFKTDKAKEQKDKLAPPTQTTAPQPAPSATAK